MVVNIAGSLLVGRRYWRPTSEPAKDKPVDIDTKKIQLQCLDSQEEDGLDDWNSVQPSIDREARL